MSTDSELIFERYITSRNLVNEMAVLGVKLLSDVIDSKERAFINPHKLDKYASSDMRWFSQSDTKYIQQLPQLIKASVGYDFVFVVDDVYSGQTASTQLDYSNITPTSNAITVVIRPDSFVGQSRNMGWNKSMPLTPHIICHKIGHALTNDGTPFQEKVTLDVCIPLLEYKLKGVHMSKTLNQEQRDSFINQIQDWISTYKEYGYQQGIEGCAFTPCELGKFKTARESLLESFGDINTYKLEPGEFFNEVIARYILTGNLSFNPWPNAQIANDMLNYLKRQIHDMLDKCIGKVISEFNWTL